MGVDPLAAVFDRETDADLARAGSVLDALDGALDAADDEDCVLVAGSLYTVGEARDRWTRAPRRVRTDTPAGASAAMARADVPGPVREERADRAVGRTLRLHARRDEATELKEAMLSLGGTAAVSGITTADEHVEVVLSGTVKQFGRLVDDLCERGGGLGHVGSQLSEPLGLEGESPENGGGLPWGDGTAVVGVLDVDPGPSGGSDDGERNPTDGGHAPVAAAVARAREMVEAGAAVVEVGLGPARGAESVATTTERDRVVPVVERLRDLDASISIRTDRPAVAGAALDAGADLVTDATGLADAGMRRVVADRAVPVVLADAPGVPEAHDGVDAREIGDAFEALTERLLLAERAGIDRSRVVLDPGLRLARGGRGAFDRLEEFRALGCPVLVGPARRSASGRGGSGRAASGGDPDGPSASVVASAALAVDRGADLLRVRDVAGGVAAVAAAERTSPGE
jgi:dihydropteroate synthase